MIAKVNQPPYKKHRVFNDIGGLKGSLGNISMHRFEAPVCMVIRSMTWRRFVRDVAVGRGDDVSGGNPANGSLAGGGHVGFLFRHLVRRTVRYILMPLYMGGRVLYNV
jgi:hypothetical protein